MIKTLSQIDTGIWILIVFSVLTTFGVSVVFPYIPIHGQEIGIPVTIIGYLVVLYYLLQAVTRIPLGKMSDIIGHHKPVLFGAIFYLIAALSFIFSVELWFLLFVGEFFLGVASSITWVTIPSYITHSKKAIPIWTFSLGIGWGLGSPTGGLIKDTLNMQWVFNTLLFVAVGLVVLAVLFYFRESEETSLRESAKSLFRVARSAPVSIPIYPSFQSYKDGLSLLRSNRKLLLASLFSFLVFMTFGLGASILPLYFSEIGITSFLIGILISIRTASSTTIRLLSTRLVLKFNQINILIVTTILAGLSMIAISLTESFFGIVILSALWGLSSGLYLPIVFDIIRSATKSNQRGIAMGVRGTLGTLGAAFGTWVFSAIADQMTLSLALLLAGAFTAAASLFLQFLRPN